MDGLGSKPLAQGRCAVGIQEVVASTIVRLHGSETLEVMSEVQPCNSAQLLQVCLAYLMLFIMITMPSYQAKTSLDSKYRVIIVTYITPYHFLPDRRA